MPTTGGCRWRSCRRKKSLTPRGPGREREAGTLTAAVASLYRTFELPWSVPPEERARFRRIVAICLALTLLLSLVMPFLPAPERDLNVPPPVPPRFAKLVLERATPAPPPPPVETREPEPEPSSTETRPAD